MPVLGDHYRVVLEGGDLELKFEPEEGSFSVNYYEHNCPLDPKTYPMVLEKLPGLPEDEHGLELKSLLTAFGNLPDQSEEDEACVAERSRDAAIHKSRLARLYAESPEVARTMDHRMKRINGEAGDAESFEALHRILEEQAYRLVYWRVASDEINYRRFFSVNDLAGIRVEDEQVFDETHRMVLDLVREGKVDGLRLDHPDGLYDPTGYFHRLQQAAAEALGGNEDEPLYVLVEKILAPYEGLPEDWPVSGTTGYEFTNLVNGLFVDPAGEAGMERAYRRFIGRSVDFEALLYDCKKIRHALRAGERTERPLSPPAPHLRVRSAYLRLHHKRPARRANGGSRPLPSLPDLHNRWRCVRDRPAIRGLGRVPRQETEHRRRHNCLRLHPRGVAP